MSNTFLRILLILGMAAVLGYAFSFFPAVAAVQFHIESWGWAIFIATVIGTQWLWNRAAWYAGEFFKLPGMNFSGRAVVAVVAKVFSFLCFTGVLLTVAKFFPQYMSFGSPTGLYIMFGGWGLMFGLLDAIESRFFKDANDAK